MVGLGSPDSLRESENFEFGRRGVERPQKTGQERKTPVGRYWATGVNWFARAFAISKLAPQFDHSAQLTFTELGLCLLTTYRKSRNVHLIPWGDPNAVLKPQKRAKAKHDPMVRARFYQSLLDNNVVESRAALSRYLGVTRARVTQVLRRLRNDTE